MSPCDVVTVIARPAAAPSEFRRVLLIRPEAELASNVADTPRAAKDS